MIKNDPYKIISLRNALMAVELQSPDATKHPWAREAFSFAVSHGLSYKISETNYRVVSPTWVYTSLSVVNVSSDYYVLTDKILEAALTNPSTYPIAFECTEKNARAIYSGSRNTPCNVCRKISKDEIHYSDDCFIRPTIFLEYRGSSIEVSSLIYRIKTYSLRKMMACNLKLMAFMLCSYMKNVDRYYPGDSPVSLSSAMGLIPTSLLALSILSKDEYAKGNAAGFFFRRFEKELKSFGNANLGATRLEDDSEVQSMSINF